MKTIDERTTITRTSGLMALTLHSENFSGIIKGHFHLATPARGSLYSVIDLNLLTACQYIQYFDFFTTATGIL